MSDYIKREDAIDRMEELTNVRPVTIRAIIESIPAADVVTWEQLQKAYRIATSEMVERKRGKWMGSAAFYLKCSECGACILKPNEYNEVFLANAGKMNFCPNCGADMRGEE